MLPPLPETTLPSSTSWLLVERPTSLQVQDPEMPFQFTKFIPRTLVKPTWGLLREIAIPARRAFRRVSELVLTAIIRLSCSLTNQPPLSHHQSAKYKSTSNQSSIPDWTKTTIPVNQPPKLPDENLSKKFPGWTPVFVFPHIRKLRILCR